jgi:hypothetical protein
MCKSPYQGAIRAKIVLLAARGIIQRRHCHALGHTAADRESGANDLPWRSCMACRSNLFTMRFLDKVLRTPATDYTYGPITPDDLAHAPIQKST